MNICTYVTIHRAEYLRCAYFTLCKLNWREERREREKGGRKNNERKNKGKQNHFVQKFESWKNNFEIPLCPC
jgi:hypothetical protein